MANYFNVIETGLRALQVQKKSLDITGHNIANANNEGYSRQRAIHTATDPYTVPGMTMPARAGQIGTGVKIAEIERIRDEFIDSQIREESQALGYWQQRFQGLHRIELTFNEPSDSSLRSALNSFWQSLQDLSNNPEDAALRATVQQRGLALVDAFHSLHNQLTDYQRSLNGDVSTIVQEINSLSRRIADLNKQIVNIKGTGQNPNDLMDERDLLFDQLNKMVNVQGHLDSRGNLNISLGGVSIVSNDSVHELTTIKSTLPGEEYQDKVVFKNTGEEAIITNGELKGIMNIRDEELTKYLDKLDEMAVIFKDRFNEVHKSGFDLNGNPGVDFFTGTDAFSFDLTDAVKNNVNLIAAATTATGVPGDGVNALNLAKVINEEKLFNDGEATLMDYHKSIISTLGIDGQRADQMVNNQNVLVDQLENQKASISRVSLDEEMANMIKFQHAYNAAAKIINTADKLLDSLMSILR